MYTIVYDMWCEKKRHEVERQISETENLKCLGDEITFLELICFFVKAIPRLYVNISQKYV